MFVLCVRHLSDSYSSYFIFKAEAELRFAQGDFDRHAEVTRLLLEGLSSSHVCVLASSLGNFNPVNVFDKWRFSDSTNSNFNQ